MQKILKITRVVYTFPLVLRELDLLGHVVQSFKGIRLPLLGLLLGMLLLQTVDFGI
jgi:hypothetical protein